MKYDFFLWNNRLKRYRRKCWRDWVGYIYLSFDQSCPPRWFGLNKVFDVSPAVDVQSAHKVIFDAWKFLHLKRFCKNCNIKPLKKIFLEKCEKNPIIFHHLIKILVQLSSYLMERCVIIFENHWGPYWYMYKIFK